MEGCRGMAGIKLREEESSNERRERQIFFFFLPSPCYPFCPLFNSARARIILNSSIIQGGGRAAEPTLTVTRQ
jgi:hypothetical protein